MGDISIVVRLKAPDPAAMTAMTTFKRINPDICPNILERYDHWRFLNPARGRETVSEIVLRYHDIVNPNKQTWSFIDDGSMTAGPDNRIVWVGVLVTDRIDSVSENWTSILCRNRFDVEGVRWSVLWRFGFASGTSEEDARKKALDLTVSSHRDHGLLANPVSQKIDLLVPLRI
jgi:hypothetical protein